MTKVERWVVGSALEYTPCEVEATTDLRESMIQMASRPFPDADAWILGTADDGVIWGRLHKGQLVTSADLTVPAGSQQGIGARVGAQLRRSTLQSLRVFCLQGELRLWRSTAGLRAVVVTEQNGPAHQDAARLDDEHPLLGAHKKPGEVAQLSHAASGLVFSILRGRAGEVHAPPIAWSGGSPYPRLLVRHYYRLQEPQFADLQQPIQTPTWQLVDTRWLSVTMSA